MGGETPECRAHHPVLLSPPHSSVSPLCLLPAIFAAPTGHKPPEGSLVLGVGGWRAHHQLFLLTKLPPWALSRALALIVIFPSFFFFWLVQQRLCRLSPEGIFSLWLTAVILGLKEITHERAAWGRKAAASEKPGLPRERELQGFIDMRKITALASGPAADICNRFRRRGLAGNYFLTQAKRSE